MSRAGPGSEEGADRAELMAAYLQTERRLRELLFGDGTYEVGAVRGEEPRRDVQVQLRRLRERFEALVAHLDAAAAERRGLDDDLRAEVRKRTKRRRDARRRPGP